LILECSMKMTLAGEAQEFTDRTDGFIRVLQQFASFFQFTTKNKGTDRETECLLEISREVGFAESYIVSNISNCQMLICILLDILNCFLNASV